MPTNEWIDYLPGRTPRCPAWGTRLYASPDRRNQPRPGGRDRRRFERDSGEADPPCDHQLSELGTHLHVRVRVHPAAIKPDGTIERKLRARPTIPTAYTTVCERCRVMLEVDVVSIGQSQVA